MHPYSAKSMAHKPVPVPRSRTRLGLSLRGARWSFLSSNREYIWCTRPMRSCSASSFGYKRLSNPYNGVVMGCTSYPDINSFAIGVIATSILLRFQ